MKSHSTRSFIGLILTIALTLGATSAMACEARRVVVNDTLLDCQTLGVFDRVVGESLADGAYWLDDLGYWGYAGYPAVMGQLDMDSLHQHLGAGASAASWTNFDSDAHLHPLGG